MPVAETEKQLVSAQRALEIIWPDEASRPSLRWFHGMQAKRLIPFMKIAGRVFFDPPEVREALKARFTVNMRGAR
jgi:hypothetical protein